MSIYKRGGVYWYKFMFDGKLIRATTKQSNYKTAVDMETTERSRLAKERDERKAALDKFNCQQVLRCPECDQWFDAATTITDSASGHQFCSAHCRETWVKKHKIIPTLADFCEKRIEPWAKSTYEQNSPKTWLWYKFGIGALKVSLLGKLRLDEIGPEKTAEFTSERQRDGLQVSSVNSCLRALRRVLRLAVEWKVIETAPQVTFLSGERRRERVITPKEEVRYLAACQPLLHDVSLILFDTGMRPEECHRLRWEHINWAGGRNGTLFIEKGKTKAARRLLPLSQRVRLMLENRWKKAGEPLDGWVWPAETKDEHINHDSLKSQHKKALKLSKLRPFEVYSIRHTFLTRLGESGCDVWTLARIAGHSNISISQRYVHPSEDAVLNALSRLGGHKIGHNGNLQLKSAESDSDASKTNQDG
ncbi:MAG TPA: site-specific integrase [Terriglobales bacterium]|nr:site-specific integrase [Terriglobales bacterium]